MTLIPASLLVLSARAVVWLVVKAAAGKAHFTPGLPAVRYTA
jgi:hypothetical protein